jgi:hypothetical protein
MKTKDFIPRKDVDFNQWIINFFTILLQGLTRFGIPQAAYSVVDALRTTWNSKFAIAEAPTTRTKATIREKNVARKNLETSLRAFIREYLTYNSKVTDGDRENLQLPIHKTTRTPVPDPTTKPGFKIDSSVIRQLILFFRDEDSDSRAKPEGVHGVELRWAILAASPASIDELVHSAFDTHSPFTLTFDEGDRGKAVDLCLRWENTRGVKGPWSEIVMAIVP